MIKSLVATIVLMTLSINTLADDKDEICVFIMDFPIGYERIHLRKNGDAFLLFGASPKVKTLTQGLFSISDIHSRIKDKLESNLPRELRSKPDATYGMVTIFDCSGSKESYLVTGIDALAENIFKTANNNIVSESF